MQNIKQQLENVGLSVVLKVQETGQTFNLEFKRGETSKNVSAMIGPVQAEGTLKLVPTDVKDPTLPNLTMVLELNLGAPAAVKAAHLPEKAVSAEPPAQPETKPEEPPAQPETKPEEPPAQPETKPEEPPAQPETKPEEPPVQPETKPVDVSIPVETEKTETVPLRERSKRRG